MTKTWSDMSNAEQVALGTTLAGVNQYKVFAAVMNNFDQAVKATEESLNSSGATARQNAIYMESLEAKVQALKTEFEKLVLGDGGLQSFTKGLVDTGTTILTFVNNLGGLKTVLEVISVLMLNKIIPSTISFAKTIKNDVISSVTKLVTAFNLLIESQREEALSGGAKEALTLSQALEQAGISASVAEIALSALTATVSVGIIAWNAYNTAQQNAKKERQQVIEDAQSEIKSLESVKKQLENENLTREELDKIIASNLGSYTDEIKKIEDLNEARQVAIDKIDEMSEKEANLAKDTGYKDYVENLKKETEDYKVVLYDMDRELKQFFDKEGKSFLGTLGNAQTYQTEGLDNYINSLQNAISYIESLDGGTEKYATNLNTLSTSLANATALQQEINNSNDSYEQILDRLNLKYDETTGSLINLTEAEIANKEAKEDFIEVNQNLIDSLIEANEITEEQAEKLKEAIQEWVEAGNDIDDFDYENAINGIKSITDSTNEAVDATERLKQANEELTNSLSQLSSMSSAYDTLSNAVAEYNANGSLSLQTLSDLNALGSEYISLLEVENGVMSISEQGLLNLANAYIDDAEAKAYDKATAELAKVAQEGLNSAQIAGQSAGSSAANGATTAGNAIAESGKKADIARQQWENAWKAIANSGGSSKSSNASANSIKSSLETTINSLEKLRTSLGKNVTATVKNMGATTKNTKATGGGTSAKKANTSANKANTSATNANTNANNSNTSSVDENTEALKKNVEALKEKKEALEKEVDEYKTVISYITSKVDEEIDKLEEQRDAEIQVIKDKIEANKELVDKEDKIIDEKIERLKEQRDIEEDYYNNKIAKLKEQNEAIEEQMELEKLLQNLQNAKNKKVKVYKKGQGFVYGTDEDEVNKAQQELDEYYRKKALEEQVKELEDARDSKLAIYDSEIKSLEQYQKDVKEYYEKINENLEQQITEITNKYASQIKPLKEWKEEFTKAVNAYQDEVNRQLAIQKTGIDFESQGWQTRIHNLSGFVKTYNNKLKELGDLEKQLQDAEEAYRKAQQATQTQTVATTTPTTSTTTTTPTSTTTTTSPTTSTANKTPTYNYKVGNYVKKYSTKVAAENYMSSLTAQQRGQYTIAYDRYSPQNYYVVKLSTIKAYNGITSGTASSYASQLATSSKSSTVYWRYATGTPSVESNQIALVGDDPKNRELVIGSKLNGTAMNLQKGSGVVNAESTNTLAGLLNCLGKFSGSNFGNGNGVLNSNTTNSQDLYIDKVVIEGSNITDIVSFKNSLMNLKSEATQRAYKHT